MSASKVLFLGSKSIGLFCLNHLLANKEKLNIEIVGVLTNPKRESSDQFQRICSDNSLDLFSSLDEILSLEVDYLISVQYHEILKAEHIDVAKQKSVNLHMAPLPEYRGCNQFSFAIIDGKTEFGTTLHEMTPGIDDGPILFEKRFPIGKEISVKELMELTIENSKVLFEESIGKLITGEFQEIFQSTLIEERGTSFHLRNEMEKLKLIDLDWSADKIDRHIRATYLAGFDPPIAVVNGRKYKIVPS